MAYRRLVTLIMVTLVLSMANPLSAAPEGTGQTLWFMFMTPTDFHLFPVHSWEAPDDPKALLEHLIAGPPEGPLHATVPSNVRVLGVIVEDGLATVDLSGEILEAPVGSSTEAIMISSMVNTLCGLPGIDRVFFTVEGKGVETLGGHISAEEPFEASATAMYGGFPDMKDHWAEGQVNAFVLRGVIDGYPDGGFKPQSQVSREEFIKLVVTSLALQDPGVEEPSFSDVVADHWSFPYVEAALGAGLIDEGDYGDMLVPAGPIPRKEMAVILARSASLDVPGAQEASYPDLEGLTALERDSIAACTAAGLLEGYEDGTFRPDGYLTRAEASTVMVRLTGMGGPDIFVAFPEKGKKITVDPVLVLGSARVFEGTVIVEMWDGDMVLSSRFTTAHEGLGWGLFGTVLPWPEGVTPSKPSLRLFWESPADGSEQGTVTLPLRAACG